MPDARLAILGSGPLEAETRDGSSTELDLDDAVTLPGPDRHPRLARARGRLRAHVALGGVRDRAARGDARRPAGRRHERERRPGGRRRRRDRAPRRARRRRGRWPRLSERCSRTGARAAALGEAGRERARTEFSVARMTERTLAVYGDVTAELGLGERRRRAAAAAAELARERAALVAPSSPKRQTARSPQRARRCRTAAARASCRRRRCVRCRRPHSAMPSAGSTGRSSARASSPTRSPAAGPTESGTAAASTATSTSSVASATPQMPTVEREHDREDEVRRRADDQQPRDLALRARARSGTACSIQIGWWTSRTSASSASTGATLAVPVADPGVDQLVGIRSSGSASTSAAAEPPRRPASSSRRWRSPRPPPRARRTPDRAGRDRRCRARTRAGRASQGSRRAPPPPAPSTIPTTTTSVEKTTLFATWTRKLLQLTPSARGAGARVT